MNERELLIIEALPSGLDRQKFAVELKKIPFFANYTARNIEKLWDAYCQNEKYLDAVELFHGMRVNL